MDTKGKGNCPKSTLRFVAEIVLIFGVSTIVVGSLAGVFAGPESVGSGLLIGAVVGYILIRLRRAVYVAES